MIIMAAFFLFNLKVKKHTATPGRGMTSYDGHHFGELVWASAGLSAPYRWYDHRAQKNDLTVYLKEQTDVCAQLELLLRPAIPACKICYQWIQG
jgi:hypothetical protein